MRTRTVRPITCRVCSHAALTAAYRADNVLYLGCSNCGAVQTFEIDARHADDAVIDDVWCAARTDGAHDLSR